MADIKKFAVGKKYFCRSICDHDCVWSYTITSRTESTITFTDDKGKVKKCRINKYVTEVNKCESVFPLGRYSMCPTLSADHEEPASEQPEGCKAKIYYINGKQVTQEQAAEQRKINEAIMQETDLEKWLKKMVEVRFIFEV